MRVDLFDFDLPPERIALRPSEPREAARLLVVNPSAVPPLSDRHLRDFPSLFAPGDILVVNDTRVLPARLTGRRARSGVTARIEAMLHKREGADLWRAFLRPAKKVVAGETLTFGTPEDPLEAELIEKGDEGEAVLRFSLGGSDLDAALERLGTLPLPPYIAGRRPVDERDSADYQTLFASRPGAVAAPTASLHFTPALVAAIEARGVSILTLTLHVGAGTFLPVKAEETDGHRMHAEWGSLDAETADRLNAAKRAGARIVAAGTTSLRLLETATDETGTIRPFAGDTAIFITPGYRFRCVDRLLTNFHLPRSTLFMLVSAFCGLGDHEARLRPCREPGLSLLQLRRRLPFEPGTMTAKSFRFDLAATDGAARAGTIHTARGAVRTPAFMPVGTAATVKAMHPHEVRALGADIVLGNVYHLMLRPGAERVAALGGLHALMRWPHPILTDSGGFQVMSLAKLRKLDETGVTFQSHHDGSRHVLTPERSMEIQRLLGSDIQMQLDECLRLPAPDYEVERAMQLSLRWAERSKAAFGKQPRHALFGIVQGGTLPGLRRASAEALTAIGFDGYAIGGLAVGEPQAAMLATLEATVPFLPVAAPRYLMGVGTPDDMLESVARGVDMFDCVMPTRAGRHGQVFTRAGKLNLRNARHADDPAPIDPAASCEAARLYSRAYLHHLVRSGEILGMMLLTAINIGYYQDLMRDMRLAIAEGRFADFRAQTKQAWRGQGMVEALAQPA